jgi:hypothetical protein
MKKVLKSFPAFFALFIMLLGTGCASIISGSRYNVNIDSEPEISEVTITDKKGVDVFKGKTPATVMLRSGMGFFGNNVFQIKYHLAGYRDTTVTIKSTLNGWYFGNLAIGGGLGMLIIDPATGAMYKIKEKNVTAKLERLSSAQATGIKIMDINSLSDKMKDQLVRIKP